MIYLSLFWAFFKVGAFSFGGGYAMIPLIKKEIIDIHHWLSVDQFLDIIAISQMTPGPIAINAATFVGYKVGGFWGSAAATIGVTAPSFLIIIILALLIIRYRHLPWLDAFFKGVRPAVIALIVQAAYSVGKSSFTGIKDMLVAAVVFVGLYLLKINPLIIIVMAAILGIVIY
ncbi:MAG: Chromate transporter [Caldanaerobacter subterraneus]|jgi:chromate transporter|uniref:chromate transporter n=1 Tax=unclassified Thermoanaerobacter TaxID=2636821 RepID=UPI0000E1E29A|nr:chromate transporter [Thermoanaerobacter sp. X514]KUK34441.1 MAG: Chromate transporter [Caldanaerobacter subterraneus]MBZ4655901.1 Chromate transporter [Thermoanaerobacter sp.]ABY93620.1 Chromate transporter [Thermoanaerobacter sp. X514]MDI3500616.1 chromate transporter [Thermoanaerobacter sp.]MDI3529542.1 chromate transporter [Thermoanaerobacter sp.]